MFVEQFYEPEVVNHGGGTVGFVGQWTIVPERGFGVFVLANSDTYALPLSDIASDALDQYADVGWAGGPGSEPVLGQLVGTYSGGQALGTVVVTEDAGGLLATLGGESVPMTHVWEDTYWVYHPGLGHEIEVTFWRGGGSDAKYLVSIWGVATR